MATNIWRRARSGALPVSAFYNKSPRGDTMIASVANGFWEAASGPTAYFKTVTGTITATGALRKWTRKVALVGSITMSATLSVKLVFTKFVSGSITASGTLFRKTARKLAASITAAGVVRKKALRKLVGSITVAGAVFKKTKRLVQGTLTIAAGLAKRVIFTAHTHGSLTPAGALATVLIAALVAANNSSAISYLRRFMGRR